MYVHTMYMYMYMWTYTVHVCTLQCTCTHECTCTCMYNVCAQAEEKVKEFVSDDEKKELPFPKMAKVYRVIL